MHRLENQAANLLQREEPHALYNRPYLADPLAAGICRRPGRWGADPLAPRDRRHRDHLPAHQRSTSLIAGPGNCTSMLDRRAKAIGPGGE